MKAIEEIYAELPEIARNLKVASADINDLVQEVALILLEYDQGKLADVIAKGGLKFFVTRIMMNQYFSKTSTYHYKFRRFNQLLDANKTIEDEGYKDENE